MVGHTSTLATYNGMLTVLNTLGHQIRIFTRLQLSPVLSFYSSNVGFLQSIMFTSEAWEL